MRLIINKFRINTLNTNHPYLKILRIIYIKSNFNCNSKLCQSNAVCSPKPPPLPPPTFRFEIKIDFIMKTRGEKDSSLNIAHPTNLTSAFKMSKFPTCLPSLINVVN